MVPEEEHGKVVTDYQNGMTLVEVGKKHRTSKQTIVRILDKHNIPRRPSGRRKIVDVTHRTCQICGISKKIEEFVKHKRRSMGYDYKCKACLRKWARERSSEVTHGISAKEFRAMEAKQGGGCAICGKPETKTKNGRVARLSVDHDHKTGRIRGLLCAKCNAGIGMFDDDTDTLKKAIDYLLSFSQDTDSEEEVLLDRKVTRSPTF